MDSFTPPNGWLAYAALVPIVWTLVHGVRKYIPGIDGAWVLLAVALASGGLVLATEYEGRQWVAMAAHAVVLFVCAVGLEVGARKPKT